MFSPKYPRWIAENMAIPLKKSCIGACGYDMYQLLSRSECVHFTQKFVFIYLFNYLFIYLFIY
jgi:hypothetical protein